MPAAYRKPSKCAYAVGPADRLNRASLVMALSAAWGQQGRSLTLLALLLVAGVIEAHKTQSKLSRLRASIITPVGCTIQHSQDFHAVPRGASAELPPLPCHAIATPGYGSVPSGGMVTVQCDKEALFVPVLGSPAAAVAICDGQGHWRGAAELASLRCMYDNRLAAQLVQQPLQRHAVEQPFARLAHSSISASLTTPSIAVKLVWSISPNGGAVNSNRHEVVYSSISSVTGLVELAIVYQVDNRFTRYTLAFKDVSGQWQEVLLHCGDTSDSSNTHTSCVGDSQPLTGSVKLRVAAGQPWYMAVRAHTWDVTQVPVDSSMVTLKPMSRL